MTSFELLLLLLIGEEWALDSRWLVCNDFFWPLEKWRLDAIKWGWMRNTGCPMIMIKHIDICSFFEMEVPFAPPDLSDDDVIVVFVVDLMIFLILCTLVLSSSATMSKWMTKCPQNVDMTRTAKQDDQIWLLIWIWTFEVKSPCIWAWDTWQWRLLRRHDESEYVWHPAFFYLSQWGSDVEYLDKISRKSSKLTLLCGAGNAILWTNRFCGHLGVSEVLNQETRHKNAITQMLRPYLSTPVLTVKSGMGFGTGSCIVRPAAATRPEIPPPKKQKTK